MVYDNIRRLCEQRGVKITALCLELGMARSTAGHWERGCVPSRPTLTKIAGFFGVSVKDLLAETPPIYNVMSDALPVPPPESAAAETIRSQQATIAGLQALLTAQQATNSSLTATVGELVAELRELRNEKNFEKRDTIPRVASAC